MLATANNDLSSPTVVSENFAGITLSTDTLNINRGHTGVLLIEVAAASEQREFTFAIHSMESPFTPGFGQPHLPEGVSATFTPDHLSVMAGVAYTVVLAIAVDVSAASSTYNLELIILQPNFYGLSSLDIPLQLVIP